MSTRELIRAFLPPIVARGLGRVVGLRAEIGEYDRLTAYDSFASALAASDSYAHHEIVDLVARRTEVYRRAIREAHDKIVKTRQTTQNLFVLSHLECQRPFDVLELGGACGATFFEMDHVLPETVRAWHLVELPATTEVGRRRFQNDRLRFFDDLEAAVRALGSRDLLMTQGGLQCVTDPMGTLDTLLALGFAYVYITRFEVSADLEQPVVVRLPDKLSANGPGPVPTDLVDRNTSYPATLFPPQTVFSRIPATYRLAFTFAETDEREKLIGSRTVTTRKVGFLLERIVDPKER